MTSKKAPKDKKRSGALRDLEPKRTEQVKGGRYNQSETLSSSTQKKDSDTQNAVISKVG